MSAMSPLAQKLASTWLRDRAQELRFAAGRADGAYTTGGGYFAARYVAAKYREAAVLLDDAATAVEDRPREVLGADKCSICRGRHGSEVQHACE